MSSTVLSLTFLALICVFSPISLANYSHQAIILQYHHVSETTPSSTSVTPDVFAQHLNLIEELGFQVKPLAEVIASLQQAIPFTQKTLAITFDDGYSSIYTEAFKQLKGKNWPFTVFISPKAIDNQHGDSMSWQEIKTMQSQGTAISNHSWQHLHLLETLENETKAQWLARISNDIDQAQLRIKQMLNSENLFFAYPYGEFNEDLKALLKEKGYIAFSQQSGAINQSSDFQSLPRFPASGVYSNIDTLKVKLNSLAFNIIEQTPKNIIRSTSDAAPLLSLVVKSENVRHQQSQCYYNGTPIMTKTQLEQDRLIITAKYEGSLNQGRSRYNCTAPAKSTNQYFWYSMPFVTIDESGTFVD